MSAHESLPLYVLGSLPDDERVAFEAHLGDCAGCRDELASLEPALSHMAAAAAAQPPPSLWAGVLARSGRTPQDAPLDPAVPWSPAPRPRAGRPSRWLAVAAAVLAFALVAVSATGLLLWQRTGELREQVAEAEHTSQMATVLAAQDAKMMEVETQLSGHLRLAVAPSLDSGVVLGEDVQDPPDGRAYQLWVMEDGRPRSAGLMSGRSGMLGMLVDVSDADGVSITVEPPAGSDAPTGPTVAHADLTGAGT